MNKQLILTVHTGKVTVTSGTTYDVKKRASISYGSELALAKDTLCDLRAKGTVVVTASRDSSKKVSVSSRHPQSRNPRKGQSQVRFIRAVRGEKTFLAVAATRHGRRNGPLAPVLNYAASVELA